PPAARIVACPGYPRPGRFSFRILPDSKCKKSAELQKGCSAISGSRNTPETASKSLGGYGISVGSLLARGTAVSRTIVGGSIPVERSGRGATYASGYTRSHTHPSG